jgi:hypothetical protein
MTTAARVRALHMEPFQRFIGIDYSGAATPRDRLPGLQAYAATPADPVAHKVPAAPPGPTGRSPNWTRAGVAAWLLEQARSGERYIAGLDFCFSFPDAYFQRNVLRDWPGFLDDFRVHWPTHLDHATVDAVREGTLHRAGLAPPPGQRRGTPTEYRLAERWTSSAKSVFLFDVNGSVAKSSHAGIPWLAWLRHEAGDRLHFWPFDGWQPDPGKSVVTEVYPSLVRNRYPRDNRTPDEQDAFAVATWLADMQARGALKEYFDPPHTPAERDLASREGWILGVR